MVTGLGGGIWPRWDRIVETPATIKKFLKIAQNLRHTRQLFENIYKKLGQSPKTGNNWCASGAVARFLSQSVGGTAQDAQTLSRI
ncbi:MAG: hypothetical protein GJ679_05985 [Rhodobacteraceae bacterium]|nr:hypothetical protein [Paracoccaceae bacterium]